MHSPPSFPSWSLGLSSTTPVQCKVTPGRCDPPWVTPAGCDHEVQATFTLVPKLQLGNAVHEALLRRLATAPVRHLATIDENVPTSRLLGAGSESSRACVPKLELGNELNSCFPAAARLSRFTDFNRIGHACWQRDANQSATSFGRSEDS